LSQGPRAPVVRRWSTCPRCRRARSRAASADTWIVTPQLEAQNRTRSSIVLDVASRDFALICVKRRVGASFFAGGKRANALTKL